MMKNVPKIFGKSSNLLNLYFIIQQTLGIIIENTLLDYWTTKFFLINKTKLRLKET